MLVLSFLNVFFQLWPFSRRVRQVLRISFKAGECLGGSAKRRADSMRLFNSAGVLEGAGSCLGSALAFSEGLAASGEENADGFEVFWIVSQG